MAFELGKFDIIAHLWEQAEKNAQGFAVYTKAEMETLWWMGFIDTEQCHLGVWRKAIAPFKREDGKYYFDKDGFDLLEKYRYKGEIFVPFDASLINEGIYTDEGFHDLFTSSIAPSIALKGDDLTKIYKRYVDDFKNPQGFIEVRKPLKTLIADLLQDFPSPLRNLELLFDRLFTQDGDMVEGDDPSLTMRAELAQATRQQMSNFTDQPSNSVEAKAVQMKDLVKAKPKKQAKSDKEKEGIELGKVRRSRRGLRG